MSDYHVAFGAVALALTFVAFFLYVRDTLWRGTKPHPFTWFLITVIDSTVFVAQVLHGGGPGTWAVGMGALLAGFTFVLTLKYGEKQITKIDWACLGIALMGIATWIVTSNALLAVVLASVSDVVVKAPTFRKSYLRPDEESVSVWSVDIVLYSLSIVALSSITWTTALFPAEIVLTNVLLVDMILLRRRTLAARPKTG